MTHGFGKRDVRGVDAIVILNPNGLIRVAAVRRCGAEGTAGDAVQITELKSLSDWSVAVRTRISDGVVSIRALHDEFRRFAGHMEASPLLRTATTASTMPTIP